MLPSPLLGFTFLWEITMKILSFLFLLFFTPASLFSAVTFTDSSTAAQLAAQIEGIGITITNPVITHGGNGQRGIFSNATDEGLEIDEGIILTCMSVDESFTTNDSGSKSITASGQYNDADLLAIDNRAFYNPIIFEFDVTLDANTRLLLIDYQFASEEYNEYVGSQYNDAFGFFISGGDLNQTYNIARVVDNQTFVTIDNIDNHPAVTVNNVNNGTVGAHDDATPEDLNNSAYFIDNTGGAIDVEYDGLTHTLHAALDNLTPGVTYHFKMALADTGDAQLDTGVFINKINGLREPSICYDYAYKQNEQYIPNDYNSSSGPVLTGTVIDNDTNYPIEVSMYIKNTQQSEIVASNVTLDVFDLNTTQATYKTESVWVTETGELYRTKINDADLNVSDSYVKDIPISSFDAFEYFYSYLSIDPLMSDLSIPINARISYTLTIPLSATESVDVNRSSLIDSDVPICSTSSTYDPVPGIFSVVHNDYYNLDVTPTPAITKSFYNIPTQVTSREGNFKVISLDANNTDQLVGRSTIVAVELVDISAFHDTQASCNEQSVAISDRIWVQIGNYTDGNQTSTMFDKAAIQAAIDDGRVTLTNGASTISNSWEFYQNARSNAAFRISYNMTTDGNDDLVKIEPGKKAGEFSINFPELVQTVGTCGKDMDGIPNNTDTVATYCRNNSDKLSTEDIAICMECIYGYNTKFDCSRDNFSIRPEAFMVHIDDQNQTVPTIQSRLTTNYSGVAAATANEINIAADYRYNLEINATNHLNNTSSRGYAKSFDPLMSTDDIAHYVWEPRDITVANANLFCNDTNDTNMTVTFFDGEVDMNTSVNQVGEYRLNILDTTWSTVDSNPAYMTHHIGSYFLNANVPDCSVNSSVTYPVNTTIDLTNSTTLSNTLTGCNIDSNHTGSTSNLVYNDYDVEFHPYEFNVNLNVTLGEAYITPPLNNAFIYMANIGQDENMSVQINTIITAKGKYSSSGLSNFVTGCYAKPLDINISKSDTNSTALFYNYNFNDYNSTGQKVISTAEINSSIPAGINRDINITTTGGYFQKNMNGILDTTTRLNYNREVNETANPEHITFFRYDVEDSNNIFASDLKLNDFADGYSDINKSTTQNLDIIHFYGRTGAKKTTIICDPAVANCTSGGTEPDVFIYYEVFCSGIVNGNTCNPALIPTDVSGNTQQRVDRRWFINLDHNTTTYGDLNSSVDSVNSTYITFPSGITYANSYTLNSPHRYQVANGLPYTAVMDDNVSRWLVHDEDNAAATLNQHTVIFRPRTEWTGAHEDDSKTKTDRVRRINRRTMW